MKQIIPLFILAIGLLLSQSVFGQQKYAKSIADSERFSAGLLIGFNNAQMDGDYQTGFDKLGVTGGIRGIARITSRLDFNMEMLYSKKGSKIFSEGFQIITSPQKDRIIDLVYVDAPMFFKWRLKDLASTWHVEVGGIYSRLVSTQITENVEDMSTNFSYERVAENFGKDDISILVGFGHTWKNGFALNGRYVFGVKEFYQNRELAVGQDVVFLRNYYYSLNLSYTIFRRPLKK